MSLAMSYTFFTDQRYITFIHYTRMRSTCPAVAFAGIVTATGPRPGIVTWIVCPLLAFAGMVNEKAEPPAGAVVGGTMNSK